MPVDSALQEALRPSELRLPAHPKVTKISVEDFVDYDGYDSLRVQVIIDEHEDLESRADWDVIGLKRAIRNKIRSRGIQLFPYIRIAKQSELDSLDDED
jgi:hypothetical protein